MQFSQFEAWPKAEPKRYPETTMSTPDKELSSSSSSSVRSSSVVSGSISSSSSSTDQNNAGFFKNFNRISSFLEISNLFNGFSSCWFAFLSGSAGSGSNTRAVSSSWFGSHASCIFGHWNDLLASSKPWARLCGFRLELRGQCKDFAGSVVGLRSSSLRKFRKETRVSYSFLDFSSMFHRFVQ